MLARVARMTRFQLTFLDIKIDSYKNAIRLSLTVAVML